VFFPMLAYFLPTHGNEEVLVLQNYLRFCSYHAGSHVA
jgi:hypothetical protein